MVMSREWSQRDYLKSWSTGKLKKGKNEAVPEKTWKDGIYIAMNERDLRVGNGIWKSEGVDRRFKTAQYIA